MKTKLMTGVGLLLLGSASIVGAQTGGQGPRAGAWGAEISMSASTDLGAALLRFRDDRSAWLFGLDATVDHQDFGDDEDLFPNENRTSISIGGRAGLRLIRSPGSAVRPIVGAGVLARTTQVSHVQRSWDAGVYGEIGLSRFFAESFSVGMTSDLQLRYSQSRSITTRSTGVRLSLDAVRVGATIVF